MSSQTRTTGGGGGGGGRNSKKTNSSAGDIAVANKKTDHVKTEKEKTHAKPTAEQMRIAQITDIKSGSDDPKMREKVANLMETTQRSEEDVCCALYECDNDMDRAATFLFEQLPVGAFETTSKKKKNRLTSGSAGTDGAGGDGEFADTVNNTGGANNNNNNDVRERSRNRSGMRGGRGGSDSRGWRGRESRENERNISGSRRGGDGGGINNTGDRGDRTGGSSGGGDGNRWQGGRGGGRGGFRGGYGSRGGGRGGSRMGPRGMNPRENNRTNYFRPEEPHETVDTWDNTIATSVIDQNKSDDTWGDWDNEEYTGSLADTKVFTPSAVQQPVQSTELSAPPGLEQQILNPPSQLTDDLVQQYQATVVSSTATAAAVNNNNQVQYPEMHASPALRQALVDNMPQITSGSLSVEQSQYFNSLTSQNSTQQSINAYGQVPQSVQYQPTGGYGTNNSYVDQVVSGVGGQQQSSSAAAAAAVRVKQRARVPPPSKIPSSAVEMPGDTLNSIGYLDVQFGGLDFGTEESFDTISEKFNATVIDNSQNNVSSVVDPTVVDYQTKASVVVQQQQQQTAGGLSAAMQTIPNSDTNDNLSSSYSQRSSNVVQQQQQQQQSGSINVGNTIGNSAAAATLEQLTKSDHYNQQSVVNASASSAYQQHQSPYVNNVGGGTVSSNKTVTYQSSAAPQGYNTSNYSSNAQQVSSGNSYPTSSNSYSSYQPQSQVNAYQQQQQQSNQSSNVGSNSSNSGVVSGVGGGQGVSTGVGQTQNIPVGVGSVNSSVNNSNSNSNSSYLSSQYPSQTSSVSYQTPQSSAYQNSSQSVYGNTGLSNNTGYTGGNTNTSTAQYSNFSSTKLSKEPSIPSTTISYDSTVSSSVTSVVSGGSGSGVSGSVGGVGVSGTAAVSSTTASSLSSPSLGLTNTKVTTNSSTSAKSTTGGVMPNIPMVSQYIQTGMPYYQQPVYSFEDIQIMQQRMPHVPTGYYDLNYQTPTSLGAAGVRDGNMGSVAYSTMSDGRFTRTDNNSSPVSNVPSSTMSQQTGSGGPMLNLPYAYFYGGNMMPSGFQYGTPAIYPQQMATANASSGAQFPKPTYNSGYGSTGYDALSQTTQEYTKSAYPGTGVGQQSKGQNVSNPPPTATGSDITSSMYGKSHVALNKVNSYEKQSFHSGTPPPFNLAGSQTAGATSAQAYGAQHLYIQAMPTAHHNINMHQPIHQMDGRIHNTSRRDSNSTGQRQQSSSQSKSGAKPGYSPSYWAAQN